MKRLLIFINHSFSPCQSNTENAGVDVNLSITSAHLNLIVAESGEHLAKHEMPNISFASGGDTVCDGCLVKTVNSQF